MNKSHLFQPIHGHSKEPLYRRWKASKRYADERDIEWGLGNYTEYLKKIPSGYHSGLKLVRIDRSLGFIEGNMEWRSKAAIQPEEQPKKKKKKRPVKHEQSTTSPGWRGF